MSPPFSEATEGFFDVFPRAAVLLDQEYRYLRVTGAWLADHGQTWEELKGRSHWEIWGDHRAAWQPLFDAARKSRKPAVRELMSVIERDGERWLRAEIHPWLRNGLFGGWLVYVENITERKRAEADALASSHLAGLGRLAAETSHEIRNPLSVIRGTAERLRGELQRETGSLPAGMITGALERIERTAERIERIADDLRRMSRTSRMNSFEDTALRSLLEEAAELTADSLDRKDILLDIRPVEELPEELTLNCDRGRLSQVLINLITNAADAVENLHDACIRIETHADEESVRVQVLDNGPGVPEKLRSRVFEPFFTTKAESVGTGLGLSIAQTILRQHGGSLRYLENGPDRHGFEINLPRRPDPPPRRKFDAARPCSS